MTEIDVKLQQRGIGLASFVKGQWAANLTGLAWIANYSNVMGLRTMDITTQMLEDLAHWMSHGELRTFRLVAATNQDDMGRLIRQLSCYLEGVGAVGFTIPWHNSGNRPKWGTTEFWLHSWEMSAEEQGAYYSRDSHTGKLIRHGGSDQARLSLALNNNELDALEDQGMIEVVLTPPNGGHLWRCDCGAVLEDIGHTANSLRTVLQSRRS